MPSLQILNLKKLQKDTGVGKEIAEALLKIFLEDSLSSMNKIVDSFASKDFDKIRMTVHAFKGASAVLGAEILSDICRKIQQKADEKDLAALEAMMPDLQKIYQETIENIQKELQNGLTN